MKSMHFGKLQLDLPRVRAMCFIVTSVPRGEISVDKSLQVFSGASCDMSR